MSRTRAIAAATVLAVATALAAAAPAHALEQEGFTLAPRETLILEYPPIPVSEAATVTVGGIVGPDECRDLPSCALVTFDVEIPDLEPGDDFYISLSIKWPSERLSDNNVQPVEQNDLDTFLYDNGQTAEAEGGSGYTEIGSSASSDNPEVIKVFEPLLGTYNLVVQNFNGANQGWTLTAESIVGDFTTPFESLAPTPGTGTVNPNNKPTTTTTSTTAPQRSTSTTVSIPEGAVLPDDDFEDGDFDAGASFEEISAAAEELSALRAGNRGDSPSALSVVLWMVVLPAALLGGGALLLARRRGFRVRLRRTAT